MKGVESMLDVAPSRSLPSSSQAAAPARAATRAPLGLPRVRSVTSSELNITSSSSPMRCASSFFDISDDATRCARLAAQSGSWRSPRASTM